MDVSQSFQSFRQGPPAQFILPFALLVTLLLAPAVKAQGSLKPFPSGFCQSALIDKPGSTIPSWSKAVETEFIDQPQIPLSSLSEDLGFMPILRHEVHTNGKTLALLYPDRKSVFAKVMFHVAHRNLEIDLILVASDLKQQGISRYLTAEILARSPEVRSIQSSLINLNLHLFQQAFHYLSDLGHLSQREVCIEAVKSTPAYKIRRSNGFTRFIQCDPGVLSPDGTKYVKYPQFTVAKEL